MNWPTGPRLKGSGMPDANVKLEPSLLPTRAAPYVPSCEGGLPSNEKIFDQNKY
jgi:hypothetical protein